MTEGEGVLTSPNYPATWHSQENCSWIIQGAQPTDRVTLHITQLSLPTYGGSDNCSYAPSSLIVREGNNAGAPIIDIFCGLSTPPSITSQGSTMQIQLNRAYYSSVASIR